MIHTAQKLAGGVVGIAVSATEALAPLANKYQDEKVEGPLSTANNQQNGLVGASI